MSDPAQVGDLMDKMRDAQKPHHKPLSVPESELKPFIAHDACPGEAYTLIGNSFNVESVIVNPDLEAKRSGCIAMMLQARAERAHCVPVSEAFDYPGFTEVLSRFERDWLGRASSDTMLGPAYDAEGNPIPTAFAVWRQSVENRTPRVLAAKASDPVRPRATQL